MLDVYVIIPFNNSSFTTKNDFLRFSLSPPEPEHFARFTESLLRHAMSLVRILSSYISIVLVMNVNNIVVDITQSVYEDLMKELSFSPYAGGSLKWEGELCTNVYAQHSSKQKERVIKGNWVALSCVCRVHSAIKKLRYPTWRKREKEEAQEWFSNHIRQISLAEFNELTFLFNSLSVFRECMLEYEKVFTADAIFLASTSPIMTSSVVHLQLTSEACNNNNGENNFSALNGFESVSGMFLCSFNFSDYFERFCSKPNYVCFNWTLALRGESIKSQSLSHLKGTLEPLMELLFVLTLSLLRSERSSCLLRNEIRV